MHSSKARLTAGLLAHYEHERTASAQDFGIGVAEARSLPLVYEDIAMAHANYQECIDACDACAQACDHCATACLQEPDVASLAECIRLDIDCAAICRLASGAMARGSSAVAELCAVCACMRPLRAGV